MGARAVLCLALLAFAVAMALPAFANPERQWRGGNGHVPCPEGYPCDTARAAARSTGGDAAPPVRTAGRAIAPSSA